MYLTISAKNIMNAYSTCRFLAEGRVAKMFHSYFDFAYLCEAAFFSLNMIKTF